MEKYIEIIDEINEAIQEFIDHLNPLTLIPKLEKEKLNDTTHCWKLKEVDWNDIPFPNGNHPGIYFLFGYKQNEENILGLYIGKASVQSNIGSRLNHHLNSALREQRRYTKSDKEGNIFELEFVATIPLKEFPFFASSLEEYLIEVLQGKKFHLLNKVGNY